MEAKEKATLISPAEIEQAVHTLDGLLSGIGIDSKINEQENAAILSWIKTNDHLVNRHPINEIVKTVKYAFEFGTVTDDSIQDILWLCKNFKTENQYYNAIQSDLQRLHGMMVGIAADGLIEKDELLNLEGWLEDHEELTGSWPYDEITSLIVEVLEDGVIDSDEHELLLTYFNDFKKHSGLPDVELDIQTDELTVGGICAIDPKIEFSGKRFCFTGTSNQASLEEIEEKIKNLGGEFDKMVNEMTHFLIVGAEGNPFWAFSTYGRKIEKTLELRKQGHKIMIIHEKDFWYAVEDAE